ncbi:hypothetical protein VTJ83DRAFT_7525 [Remersonia thermophila]|uniref:Pheromone receptor n=1 Tax=Remersonia thermophila TaxID=72144 RepID=A0ABR4D3Q6_9PEZI
MSSNDIPRPGLEPPGTSPPPVFEPLNQTATLLYSDGITPVPYNTHFITKRYVQATSLSIEYGSQIGACLIMLCVVLAMTPRHRFRRAATLISIASLLINTARMVLLSLFFTTPWVNLYVLVTHDASVVPRSAYNLSAAATILSVPVTVLILAALGLQAWSMIQLWRARWKLPALAISALLVLATIAFSLAITVLQVRATLYADLTALKSEAAWLRKAYLVFITTSICWFCFLFNVRLAMHMWTNRSILPSLKGLKAMDALVITNGILMLVPVIFAALEWFDWDHFEPGSLTQTSVVIVLPLGTLVAQRLASPSWFGTGPDPASGASACSHCGRGGCISGAGTAVLGGHGSHANTAFGGATVVTTTSSVASRGTTGAASVGKRPLLAGWKRVSGGNGNGTEAYAGLEKERNGEAGEDVAKGSEKDLEQGLGGVRVDYGIARTEERVQTGSS